MYAKTLVSLIVKKKKKMMMKKKRGRRKEVKNKIEKDDKGEEGLQDDVDADKDYWKKKQMH